MNGPSFDRTDTYRAAWTELPGAVDALWDACMQDQRGSDVARALTANFVGVAAAPHADCLLAATDQLQQRSPCRACLLLIDDDSPSEVAELAATTRKHGPLRDIVLEQIESQSSQAIEIALLEVGGRWLHDHLELVVVLQAVRVLAIPAILWPSAWLNISRIPVFGA